MASKRIKKSKQFSQLSLPVKIFLKTLFLTSVLYTLAFLLSAAVGLSMNISKGSTFYLSVFAFSCCSFAGAFYAGRKIERTFEFLLDKFERMYYSLVMERKFERMRQRSPVYGTFLLLD